MTLYDHVPPPGRIVTSSLNRFVLHTEETRYHNRSSTERPVVDSLAAGSYVISAKPYCVLDIPFWMLRGVHVRDFDYSITLTDSVIYQQVHLGLKILNSFYL